jgi:Protein of unknown function (DUF1638)
MTGAYANCDDEAHPKCLIIACGALAKEVVYLQRHLDVPKEALTLQCVPAEYHNTPQKIAPAVEAILKERRDDFDTVLVGYGDCGTGGALDEVLKKYDAERLPGAHCYEFFAGSALFEEITDAEIGSFFLTDYLVKFFDRLVIQGLGLDRYPHLRDIYFSNYKQVVYLAQVEDAALKEKAEGAARQLGLEFVYKYVGYGDLTKAMRSLRASANRVDTAPHTRQPGASDHGVRHVRD